MENHFKDASLTGYKNLNIFIKTLIPFFIRNQYPNFTKFVSIFLKKFSEKGSGVELIQNMLAYANIDETSAEFLERFCKEYLKDIQYIDSINKRTLVKWIRQFYEAVGSEQSFKFIFRVLFNEDIDFYYPTVDIQRISDGKWLKDHVIKIERSKLSEEEKKYYEDLVGTEIEGVGTNPYTAENNFPSHAKALIEKVNFLSISVDDDKLWETDEVRHDIVELFVTDYSKDFPLSTLQKEEYIRLTCLNYKDLNGDPVTWLEKTHVLLSSFDIYESNNFGMYFEKGDVININHPKGLEGRAIIENVNTGNFHGVEIIKPGDGYRIGERISLEDGYGYGAYGYITEIESGHNIEEARRAYEQALIDTGDTTAANQAVNEMLISTGGANRKEAERRRKTVLYNTTITADRERAYSQAHSDEENAASANTFAYLLINDAENRSYGLPTTVFDTVEEETLNVPNDIFTQPFTNTDQQRAIILLIDRGFSKTLATEIINGNNWNTIHDVIKGYKLADIADKAMWEFIEENGNITEARKEYDKVLKESATISEEEINATYEAALKRTGDAEIADAAYEAALNSKGGIKRIVMGSQGEGYLKYPKVIIDSKEGSGAVLYPHGNNIGTIQSIKIINSGFGYIPNSWEDIKTCFNYIQEVTYLSPDKEVEYYCQNVPIPTFPEYDPVHPTIQSNRYLFADNTNNNKPSYLVQEGSIIKRIGEKAYIYESEVVYDNQQGIFTIKWKQTNEAFSKVKNAYGIDNYVPYKDNTIPYILSGMDHVEYPQYKIIPDVTDTAQLSIYQSLDVSKFNRLPIEIDNRRHEKPFYELSSNLQNVLSTAVKVKKCYTFPLKFRDEAINNKAETIHIITFYKDTDGYGYSPELIKNEIAQCVDTNTGKTIRGRILRIDNERGIMAVDMISNSYFYSGMVLKGSKSNSTGNVILNVYRTELSVKSDTNVLTSGYYNNTDGFVSGNKKIQDSWFYQDFSYVILSEMEQSTWDKAVHDSVHPTGTIVFGQGVLQNYIYGPSYGGLEVNTDLSDEQIGSICVTTETSNTGIMGTIQDTDFTRNYLIPDFAEIERNIKTPIEEYKKMQYLL